MATDISPEKLAKWTFGVTFAGFVAYVLVVAFYVLNPEPSHTPQTAESSHP